MSAVTPYLIPGLTPRAEGKCPSNPRIESGADHSLIYANIDQISVDTLFRCRYEGKDNNKYFSVAGPGSADKSKGYDVDTACWITSSIDDTCEDSNTWKCIQDRKNKDKIKGTWTCLNPGDKGGDDTKKGGVGKMGVDKMMVIGVVMGLVVTNIIGML